MAYLLAGFFVLGLFLPGLTRAEDVPQAPLEKLSVAVPKAEASALILLAIEKGFFAKQGLDVTLQEYEMGADTFKAVLSGKADLGAVEQAAVVNESFDRDDFSVLATIYSSNKNVKVVARRDKGIQSPQDLRGKKIGVARWTSGHFFLSSFLIHHNLVPQSVRIKNMSPSKMLDALSRGKIDAFSFGEPYAFRAGEQMKDNAVVFALEDVYVSTLNVAGLSSWIRSRPAAVRNFLKALHEAQVFIRDNRPEAVSVLSSALGLSPEYLQSALEEARFMLSLDQGLLILMEREAQWMIRHHLTKRERIPNYLDYVYFEPLEEVEPSAVGIIH